VLDPNTRVLISIRDEIRDLEGEVHDVKDGLRDLTTEVRDLKSEVRTGLSEVNARLENLRGIAGDRYRDLDLRIRVLEARVLGSSGARDHRSGWPITSLMRSR
jgi:hypothetical protein